MPLIRDGRLSEDDWTEVADDTPLGADFEGKAIVSLERWRAEREDLLKRNAPIGVRLRSDQAPTEIAEDLSRLELVALEFPKFTDGRAYSYARLLRERYHFKGELRAVGMVLRDQFLFMARCGFDALEVQDPKLAEAWEEAQREIAVTYQPTGDGRNPAWALRHGMAAVAPALLAAGLAGHWAY